MTKYVKYNHFHRSPQFKAEIGEVTKARIRDNSRKIKSLLAKGVRGLSGNTITSFHESVKEYNDELRDWDIKAWVAFKRMTGIPMKGWEKWFVDSKEEQSLIVVGKDINDVGIIDKTEGAYCNVGHKMAGCVLGYGTSDNFITSDGRICTVSAYDSFLEARKCYVPTKEAMEELFLSGAMYYYKGFYLPKPLFACGEIQKRIDWFNENKDEFFNIFSKYEADRFFEDHIRKLHSQLPVQLHFDDPDPDARPFISPWNSDEYQLSSECYDSSKYELKVSQYGSTSLLTAFSRFLLDIPSSEIRYSLTASQIISFALYGKKMKGDSKLNARVKGKCIKEAKRLFVKFLTDCLTPNGKEILSRVWNERCNNISEIDFKQVPIGFSHSKIFGNSDFSLRPIQKDGVRFVNGNGSGCVSFDVGVGKTITAISIVAEAVQEGRCKRPIIIVPKSTYPNWKRELVGEGDAKGVLSDCGIKLNLLGNGGDLSSIEVKDGTISLATVEFLQKIKYESNLDFSQYIRDVALQNRPVKEEAAIISDINDIINGLIHKKDKTLKDSFGKPIINTIKNPKAVDFSDLGFDFVVMDEAHRYKNLFGSLPMQKNDFLKQVFHTAKGSVSSIGLRALFFNQFIQGKNGGVVLLTATPFSNRPLEILSMLTLVSYDKICRYGYSSPRSFFDTFVDENFDQVVNADMQIVWDYSIDSFFNKKVLQSCLADFILYKTGDDAGILRPAKIDIPFSRNKDGILPQSQQVLSYLSMSDVQDFKQKYINFLSNDSGSEGNKGEDAKFSAMSKSLENAFSPFAFQIKEYGKFVKFYKTYDKSVKDFDSEFEKFNRKPKDCIEFVESSPKIKYTCDCVKSVLDYCMENNLDLTGQVIFSRYGIPFFPFIKDYLQKQCNFQTGKSFQVYDGEKYVEKKVDEVEIIAGGMDSDDKELIMNAFNQGVVKVIIGSPTIQEGVNLQKKSALLYCLSPFWNPTDFQQLEGRIYRQGNKYQYVRIVQPLMQNSMDVFVYQKLQEKMGRVNDLWSRKGKSNVFNFDNLDPLEVKLALITDLSQLTNIEIEKEIDELNAQERSLSDVEKILTDLSSTYSAIEGMLNILKSNIKQSFRNIENKAVVARDGEFSTSIPYLIRNSKEDLKNLSPKELERVNKNIQKYQQLLDKAKKELDGMGVLELEKFYEEILKWGATITNSDEYYLKGDKPYWAGQAKQKTAEYERLKNQATEYAGWEEGDDIDEYIEDVTQRLLSIKEEKEKTLSSGHRDDVMEEIEAKKRKQGVLGATIEVRVQEFCKLNYLLKFDFVGFAENNVLPKENSIEQSPISSDDDLNSEQRLRLAMAKTKILKLKMAVLKI